MAMLADKFLHGLIDRHTSCLLFGLDTVFNPCLLSESASELADSDKSPDASKSQLGNMAMIVKVKEP